MTAITGSTAATTMSPEYTSHQLQLEPLKLQSTAKEVDFGIKITGLDLAKLSDAEFAALKDAVYRHLVVVIPGQGHLTPQQQLRINKLFDPEAVEYGHGSNESLMRASALVNDLISLPSAPSVKLLGNGPVASHDGLVDVTLRHPMHTSFHRHTLPSDDFEHTRFYRWHLDAALYAKQPPRVTTLLCLTVPQTRMQLVRYDDGSGDTLEVPLATTAFISSEYAFRMLSPEAKAFALKVRVRYHAHPYIWMKQARAMSTGLGLETEGKEVPDDQLPEWSEDQVCILPAVWKNPVTGALALQIHPCCVEDLLLDGKSLGKGDLGLVRQLVNKLLRPGISPARVLAHEWAPGDMVIFHNRSVLHSVTGTLRPHEHRMFYQCNLAGSDPVVGPDQQEIGRVLQQAGVDDVDQAVRSFISQ